MNPIEHAGAQAGQGRPAGLDAGLDEPMLPADPLALFDQWMADVLAAALPEPTAMVLATASAAGPMPGWCC